MQVALVDNKPGGYTVAEAPADEAYTWWRGITVAREYEKPGLDVGRTLEADRQTWGIGIDRPVRVRIPNSNKRSLKFFGDQGFNQVDTEAPTSQRPLPFIIMELRLTSLQSKAVMRS